MLRDIQTETTPATRGVYASDYEIVRRAIALLTEQSGAQPDFGQLARHLHLSTARCEATFKRWCGLSTHAFIRAVTADRGGLMLQRRAALLDTARQTHPGSDFFVEHEVITSSDLRRHGEGLEIAYGFHACPFGDCLLMATERGIAGLAFVDEDKGQSRAEALTDMTCRWPLARYREEPTETAKLVPRIFDSTQWRVDRPLRLELIGTDFDVSVWRILLGIRLGQFASYSDIAQVIGKPSAARAVGTAVGRNPISFIVPCHRVLRGDGGLGGYYWGLTRKQAMIAWEIALSSSRPNSLREIGQAHGLAAAAFSSKDRIALSFLSVNPTSSRPFRRQCLRNGSISNLTVPPSGPRIS